VSGGSLGRRGLSCQTQSNPLILNDALGVMALSGMDVCQLMGGSSDGFGFAVFEDGLGSGKHGCG